MCMYICVDADSAIWTENDEGEWNVRARIKEKFRVLQNSAQCDENRVDDATRRKEIRRKALVHEYEHANTIIWF